MPAVQIRDLPQKTYNKLKHEARVQGRSINKQTEVILTQYFSDKNSQRDCSVATDKSDLSELLGVSQRRIVSFAPELPVDVEHRIAKRQAVFDKIDAQEPIDVPCGYEPWNIVRQMRDSR